MGLPFITPKPAVKTLRVIALLLSYPTAEVHAHLQDMAEALVAERVLPKDRQDELLILIERMACADLVELEASYVETFDRGRSASLHLFEHVHGDSRDRGPAMIDLAQTYHQAGLNMVEGELPDYLPAVIEYASTQPAREARSILEEVAHILSMIFSALQQKSSPYASLLGALIELAGKKAEAVRIAPEEHIDEAWMEPAAFDGCSMKNQSKPGQQQTIQVVRKNSGNQGAIV